MYAQGCFDTGRGFCYKLKDQLLLSEGALASLGATQIFIVQLTRESEVYD